MVRRMEARPLARLVAALILTLAAVPAAAAKRPPPTVEVDGPYIELHSGPGRGYPVFHTVERGGRVELLKRRTDWYRVRSGDVEGWVNRGDLDRMSGDAAIGYSTTRSERTLILLAMFQ